MQKMKKICGFKPNNKPQKTQTQNFEPNYRMCQILEVDSSVVDTLCGREKDGEGGHEFGFQANIHNIYK